MDDWLSNIQIDWHQTARRPSRCAGSAGWPTASGYITSATHAWHALSWLNMLRVGEMPETVTY
jgi:hypothetical protein